MKMKQTRGLFSVLILFAFVVPCFAAPKKPKLVVALVVDQFRYDYLLRFRADYHGGIARLLENGAVFTDAHYVQFPTVTAIGHSTFMTGATPSVSGIIGNEWFDRATGRSVTSVSDDSTRLLGGVPGATGSSPNRLLVSALGDELKMADKRSKVIGISVKDRSSILPSGHMADAAYWFDNDSNHFVSSTYYMNDLPAWVKKVNQDRPTAKYLGAEWMPVNTKPGDKPFCTLTAGTDVRFCGTLELTPFSNEMLEEFAEKAIENEQLGAHETTDVLALSFSANDYVGHQLGPDAPEVRDISIRTDLILGKLLDFLDAKLGAGNTLVVFTADHGVAPVPEVNQARKMPGGRLDQAAISKTIGAAIAARFGDGNWLVFDNSGFIYLNYDTIKKNNADPAEVRRVAAEAARLLPHIARVYTRDQLLRGEGAASGDFQGRAVQFGFYGPRSGDLFLLPEPYYMFAAAGTTHALPYSYDSHVPLIFYGAGIRAGIHSRPVTMNDAAPTLAEILQVETPSGASGRILAEVLQ
ncbi:MAG TPA: alkaline phosphatase family protein [Verrucomicrobiae bacterium]|jgi:predicted AlkP superfamily pyrophosphatase or phosphodiesterase|nr:alkaline phosphatase family protein [Verrucomicrobiae bacterium]